jgi:hypothetical protein
VGVLLRHDQNLGPLRPTPTQTPDDGLRLAGPRPAQQQMQHLSSHLSVLFLSVLFLERKRTKKNFKL